MERSHFHPETRNVARATLCVLCRTRGVWGLVESPIRPMALCFLLLLTQTLEQWWMNLLLAVKVCQLYNGGLGAVAGRMLLHPLVFGLLRVALFPFAVWSLELLEGYFLMTLYGYNPAWTYTTPDARFHGNIRLGYAPCVSLCGDRAG